MSSLMITDARVPMRDGTLLATDVITADDERRPVLLVRTPYSRAGAWAAHDPVGSARRGWAVVLQDVRGRGDSGGQFQPFHQEIDDGFDTIAWCAEQPWSNGSVVMTGSSYNGLTQWLAASSRPPALKAIAPSVIGPDLLTEFAFEHGVFQQGFLSGWAIALAASDPDPAVAAKAIGLIPRWPALLGDDAGREVITEVLPDYARWIPLQEDYWPSINPAELDLPVWRLAGWYDTFCEGTLSAYASANEHTAQRLIVGPWTHAAMHSQTTPEVDFGPDAHGLLLAAESDAFLRAAVDGTSPKTGVTVFVMGENSWRDLKAWPPASTPVTYFLGAAGDLVAAPVAGQMSWKHDPDHPVPTRGGRTLQAGLPLAGPVDQRDIEARTDVLVFTSAPLTKDITVIGTVRVQLEVVSSAETFDVTVKVCDVHPDGRSFNVVDSVVRLQGGRQSVDLAVGSTALTLRRGHLLRIDLASSDYPRYDQLPAAEQTVFLAGSHVCLPVVPPESP